VSGAGGEGAGAGGWSDLSVEGSRASFWRGGKEHERARVGVPLRYGNLRRRQDSGHYEVYRVVFAVIFKMGAWDAVFLFVCGTCSVKYTFVG